MHTCQFWRYLREAPGEHTYLPKRTGIFPFRMFLYYKNKARGEDIIKEKGISDFVKIKNLTMIQLNPIQLTIQTPNHVKMAKILSTSQRESTIIDC